MKEYIERELALQLLEEQMSKTANCTNDEIMKQTYLLAKKHAEEYLKTIPAADVKEVRHGRWLYVSGEGRYAEYECSECKKHVCFDEKIDGTIPEYKGCPHCLAKMDGKGDA